MKTLKDAKVGETVTVVRLHGEGALKRRIMDMGVTKGTEIYIRKVAPLGDRWRPRCAATSSPSARRTPSSSRSDDAPAGEGLLRPVGSPN